jgi:hypothetical protein
VGDFDERYRMDVGLGSRSFWPVESGREMRKKKEQRLGCSS